MREAIREPVKYYFGDAVRNRGVWVAGLAPFFGSHRGTPSCSVIFLDEDGHFCPKTPI